MFVVGIFSGTDKLGEGFGSSLRMAEYRAAEDALLHLYLTRHPQHLAQMPSEAIPKGNASRLFDPSLQSPPFSASPLGHSEILLHSAGRGSRVSLSDEYSDTVDG